MSTNAQTIRIFDHNQRRYRHAMDYSTDEVFLRLCGLRCGK